MTTVSILVHKLQYLTVDEACWLLRVYRHQHDEVFYRPNSDKIRAYWTTPCEFELNQTRRVEPAAIVRVRFLGGPGGVQKYYGGNLVSLVVDRILRAFQTQRVDFTWLLSFSPYATQHIRKQLKGRVPDALQQQTFSNNERYEHYESSTIRDRKRADLSFDNPAVDYAQIDDKIYSIHENGSQGCVVHRAGTQTPNPSSQGCDQCKSSGRIKVRV